MKNQVIRNNIQTATSSLHDPPPAHKKRKNPLDGLDIKIINLMAIGSSNNEISQKLAVPLSTIQRTRLLLAKGYVRLRGKINYRKLGYRKGVFHVYLRGDSAREIAEKIADIAGVHDVALFMGNADIVGVFIFKDADDILHLKNSVKSIKGVDRIVWTEEVYTLPERQRTLLP